MYNSVPIVLVSLTISGGSRICQRGRTMSSAWSASLNGSIAGSMGRASGGGGSGVQSPLKLKAYCPFSFKKWPKVEDLNKNLPPCLRQTALRRHDHCSPNIWSMGGGLPQGIVLPQLDPPLLTITWSIFYTINAITSHYNSQMCKQFSVNFHEDRSFQCHFLAELYRLARLNVGSSRTYDEMTCNNCR